MLSYVELRCRSAFSFLAASSLPEDLVARAAALGYATLALGDRDGVYGAPRFHKAAQATGLRALVGAEVGLATGTLYLLAATRTGYRNLCRLITQMKLRAPKGQGAVAVDDLIGHTDGLVCLLRPPYDGVEGAGGCGVTEPIGLTLNSIPYLRSLFPNRLYLDLQRHLDPDEERLNQALIAVARQYRVPLVATNDVRHALPAGRPLLDVLTCIREKTTLDTAGRRLLRNAERHLKSPAEMAALFRDLPEAVRNTRRIAEQCEFTLADLGYRFPDYPLPPGETPIGHLRILTYAGARDRYGTLSIKVRRQLEHELAVIGKLDLAGYFLIVWDIVRFCREQGILAQGRGSAANSAVCYALGITAVDAVGMDLLFERFLSEERGEWPDIDIDLPSGDRRERVIQYVYQRYGERGAAMTANVITYRTRSAVREVGKALGFTLAQVDKLSKLLNRFELPDSSDALAQQLRAGGVDPTAPRVGLLVDLVQQIQHLPRHLGQHSGGMVIAAGRLDTVVPLEPASMPGRVVVQWDKDDCADLGIIKVDLLGLGMMAVLEEVIPLIREHEGVDIDLAHLPPDDPKTYAMLRAADTIGVFQVESRAQMATLPRLRPDHFYDLVVEVALIRPGPIVGQMVHPYLNRRNGREPVTYAHPDLEPILKRTLGVPLFQEQLLRMAMVLAGFTGGEAEELRRAMGFKRSVERMQAIEQKLRAGMAGRGIAGDVQDTVVRSITSFALYGFPESHAASFALLAYASAYLRAHHPAAFTCAMLNNWPLGFYHPATLVKDAQRHGLRVLPVDVTRSGWRCGLEQVVGAKERKDLTAKTQRRRADVETSGAACPTFRFTSDELRPVAAEGVMPRTRSASLRLCGESYSSSGVGLLSCEVVGSETEKRTDTASAKLRQQQPDDITTNNPSLRLGLRFVAGLRAAAAERIETERAKAPFVSVDDVVVRCGLRDDEARTLAHIGAFAAFGLTRREALWQVSAVAREPLFSLLRRKGVGSSGDSEKEGDEEDEGGWGEMAVPGKLDNPATCPFSPLSEMSPLDRTLADYRGTGMTVGPHLMKHLRAELTARGVVRACDLPGVRDGRWVKIAGLVIVRQRPGSAKGFCFLTLEDETGTCNAVVVPDMFRRYRTLLHTATLLLVEGPVEKVVALRVGSRESGVESRESRPCERREVEQSGSRRLPAVSRQPSAISPDQRTTNNEGRTTNDEQRTPDPHPVIHVRARRLEALSLPRQRVGLTGRGYRMRVTPGDDEPPQTPKSHDFR